VNTADLESTTLNFDGLLGEEKAGKWIVSALKNWTAHNCGHSHQRKRLEKGRKAAHVLWLQEKEDVALL